MIILSTRLVIIMIIMFSPRFLLLKNNGMITLLTIITSLQVRDSYLPISATMSLLLMPTILIIITDGVGMVLLIPISLPSLA